MRPSPKRLTLVHHRDGFRAAQHSVNRMRELVSEGKIDFHVASVKALHGHDGRLEAVTLASADKKEWMHEANALLPFFGLTIKLGPIAEFGLNFNENLIPVDTEKFQSSTPGIFAIGDINTYPGKLKLILSGFHEGGADGAGGVPHLPARTTSSASNTRRRLRRCRRSSEWRNAHPMKIIARDRKGVEHVVDGTDGWTVMEALRDAGLPDRRRMRRRVRLRHLPRLCRGRLVRETDAAVAR